MTVAYMFPGQGAQEVGMGADLVASVPEAKAVFDQADAVLGFKISELCFGGPAEKLNATDVQQPAILTTSIACLEAFRASEKGKAMAPAYAAGLSLGEYVAYYAAGALDLSAALKLIQARATYMQEASVANPGGMVAIVGLDDDKAVAVAEQARQGEVLVAANFNCPGQVVLSGHKSACERVVPLAEAAGAMKAIVLDVAGAFHSPLMASAAEKLRSVLEATEFRTPKIPVIANVDCQMHSDPAAIRENLYRQVTSATRWGQSMQKLLELGVDQFVELGPKKTLAGFMKRIARKTTVVNVASKADLA